MMKTLMHHWQSPLSLLKLTTVLALLFGLAACSDEDEDSIEAAFTYEANGLDVSFTSTTTGEVSTYSWDFGDGQTSDSPTAMITYGAAGTYTVTLTVNSGSGSDSETQMVTVEDNGSSSSPTPEFSDADATLAVVNSITFAPGPFPIEITTKTGAAAFGDPSGFVSVGAVSLNGDAMTQNPNNSYTFLSLGMGAFSGDVTWTADGGNGFSAINQTVTQGFPTVTSITPLGAAVALDSDLTVSTSGAINNSDSVLFLISDQSGNTVSATEASNVSSHTFTVSDLSTLSAGSGIVQVAAYNFVKENIGGKNIYFINESTTSAFATFQ